MRSHALLKSVCRNCAQKRLDNDSHRDSSSGSKVVTIVIIVSIALTAVIQVLEVVLMTLLSYIVIQLKSVCRNCAQRRQDSHNNSNSNSGSKVATIVIIVSIALTVVILSSSTNDLLSYIVIPL